MIPQLKAKLEEEIQNNLPVTPYAAFRRSVSILMPVIEKLVEQRNDQTSYREDIRVNGAKAEIDEMNQEILNLLEGGE